MTPHPRTHGPRRALFSKLQYLTQVEDLVPPEAAQQVDLRKIFGATEVGLHAPARIGRGEGVQLDAAGTLCSTFAVPVHDRQPPPAGSTQDDAARLRIVSLQEVDLEQLMEGESAARPDVEEVESPARPAEEQNPQE